MLEAQLASAHDGEGLYPTWPAGTRVHDIAPCPQYRGWCKGQVDGQIAYFPENILQNSRLTCAYNPTELALPQGSRVHIHAILGGWAWVAHQGQRGWLPLAKLDSPVLPRAFQPEE